jgi:hypothetical protein
MQLLPSIFSVWPYRLLFPHALLSFLATAVLVRWQHCSCPSRGAAANPRLLRRTSNTSITILPALSNLLLSMPMSGAKKTDLASKNSMPISSHEQDCGLAKTRLFVDHQQWLEQDCFFWRINASFWSLLALPKRHGIDKYVRMASASYPGSNRPSSTLSATSTFHSFFKGMLFCARIKFPQPTKAGTRQGPPKNNGLALGCLSLLSPVPAPLAGASRLIFPPSPMQCLV